MQHNVVNELTLRYKSQIQIEETLVNSPQTALPFLRKIWNDQLTRKESFYVILLNSQKRVMGYSLISQGGKSATIVDVPEVIRLALIGDADSIILAHNHPSGNPKPSTADINLTKRISEAGKILGISVVDHIILWDGGFTSMREQDLIR